MFRAALAFPLERISRTLLAAEPAVDFARPVGEPAVVPPDSVSWRIFSNPVSMFIGGVAAVLLELGEPRVRSGVWDHSSFRADPARRLRRTGLAAMITVYGARSRMEETAARVRAMHSAIKGVTPCGQPYRADDPELLRWVQATAAFAFLAAYDEYVRPIAAADRDAYYDEARAGAAMYGVSDPPSSEAEFQALVEEMRPRLEPSLVLGELLTIIRAAPILPPPLRPFQHMVARAAVDLLPPAIRADLRLDRHGGLSRAEAVLLRAAAFAVDRVPIASSPASQACVRLGLPYDYLLRRSRR
jgi:uncharacterized protein (DUF2236 family)